ncbi:MAG: 50S ribosomal protein L21 [Citromicrobium sp.]|nr:MAG: 50S ribosomal protein L21 [Citromicrobium sp.]
MFAVVRTGGKQYRVAAGDKIAVEKLAGEAGDTVTLGDVLLAGNGDKMEDAAKVKVSAEIIAQAKSEKVIVFKKRRRHNYRRKNGHRQQMTLLRITQVGDSKAEAKAAAPKKEAAPKKAEETKAAPKKDTSAKAAAPKAEKAAPKKAAATEKAPAKKAAKTDLDTTNLSLISGIGPAIEKKLHAAGVKSWEDIAAWDKATMAKMDEELTLGNRPENDEWVAQAKELLAGKPPRAKVDQAEAKASKKK